MGPMVTEQTQVVGSKLEYAIKNSAKRAGTTWGFSGEAASSVPADRCLGGPDCPDRRIGRGSGWARDFLPGEVALLPPGDRTSR